MVKRRDCSGVVILISNEFGCLAHQLKLYSVYETYNYPIGLLEREFERFIVVRCRMDIRTPHSFQ